MIPWFVCGFVLSLWFSGILGCDAPAKPTDDFHVGRELVIQGKYAEAIPHLEKYLKHNAKQQNASRAGLFLGKAHLGQGDLEKASLAFQEVIQNYPDSLESHKCRYKLALLALIQGNDQTALRLYTELAEHPDGPLDAEASVMRDYLKKREANR